MFKKNNIKSKKKYKLVIRQKRGEDDIVTIDYSNAKKLDIGILKGKNGLLQ